MEKPALVVAIFGCIIFNLYTIYAINYYLGLLEWHPYPDRIWLLIIINIIFVFTINILTFILAKQIRHEKVD